MIEYVKKSDVLEIINSPLPRDLTAEYIFDLKGVWLDEDEADTPQTDKDKVVCPNCGRSDYIRSFEKDFGIKNSEYRYKCINCNTYIKDTPQTESTGSPIGDYRDGVGAWQTDCGWK